MTTRCLIGVDVCASFAVTNWGCPEADSDVAEPEDAEPEESEEEFGLAHIAVLKPIPKTAVVAAHRLSVWRGIIVVPFNKTEGKILRSFSAACSK